MIERFLFAISSPSKGRDSKHRRRANVAGRSTSPSVTTIPHALSSQPADTLVVVLPAAITVELETPAGYDQDLFEVWSDDDGVKRIAFGFRRFRAFRLRALLYAGNPNWDLLATITPS